MTREFGYNPIHLSASTTDSSLLDLNQKVKKDTYMQVPGILSACTFAIYPEARVLFEPGKWNSEIREIILSVMEPIGTEGHKYKKSLGSWNNEAIDTTSSASIIFTTRPIVNLREDIIRIGHLQRTIFYPRELSKSIRKEMNIKNSEALLCEVDFETEKKEIVKDINERCNITELPQIQDKDKFVGKLKEFGNQFTTRLNKIQDREDIQIANTFLARYQDYLVVLSFHSAILRGSKYVEDLDLQYGFDLLEKVFDQLCLWIEISTNKDWRVVSDREKKLKQIQSWIQQAEQLSQKSTLQTLAKQYSRKYGKSKEAGISFIESNEENSNYEILDTNPKIVKIKEETDDD